MEELQNVVRDGGLAVSNLPEKGRCLLTTKNFNPGLSSSFIYHTLDKSKNSIAI
jgi:hypothetical protein